MLDLVLFCASFLVILLLSIAIFWFTSRDVQSYALCNKSGYVILNAVAAGFNLVGPHALITLPLLGKSASFEWLWLAPGVIVGAMIAVALILPIFYYVRPLSIFYYADMRFCARKDACVVQWLRVLCSLLYAAWNVVVLALLWQVNTFVFAYAHPLPSWIYLLLFGCFVAVTTAFGGFRLVLWCCSVSTFATVGSAVFTVSEAAKTGGFVSSPLWANVSGTALSSNQSPYHFATVTSVIFAGVVYFLHGFIAEPYTVQCYTTVSSARRARLTVAIAGVVVLLLISSSFGLSLTLFGSQVERLHAVTVELMLDEVLSPIALPGLKGLVLASYSLTIFSFSAGKLQSIAISIYDDIVLATCWRNSNSKRDTRRHVRILQLITLCCGLFVTLISVIYFAVAEHMFTAWFVAKTLVAAASCSGALLGLFALAIFFPCANAKGCLAGLLCGVAVAFVFVGGYMYLSSTGATIHVYCSTPSHNVMRRPVRAVDDDSDALKALLLDSAGDFNETGHTDEQSSTPVISSTDTTDESLETSSLTMPSTVRASTTRTPLTDIISVISWTTRNLPASTIQSSTTPTSTEASTVASDESNVSDPTTKCVSFTQEAEMSGIWTSPLYAPLVGTLTTVVIGLLVSMATGCIDVYTVDWNLLYTSCYSVGNHSRSSAQRNGFGAASLSYPRPSSYQQQPSKHQRYQHRYSKTLPRNIHKPSSESFRSVHLAENVYRNPRVQTLHSKESTL